MNKQNTKSKCCDNCKSANFKCFLLGDCECHKPPQQSQEPRPIEDWDLEFDEKFQGGYENSDTYEDIKSFIRTKKAEWQAQARQQEQERLLNQKANQHDQEVRKQVLQEVREKVKLLVSPIIEPERDVFNEMTGYQKAVHDILGFLTHLEEMEKGEKI